MQSGRQTLASLDDGMRQLHDTVGDLDRRVRDSSNALMALQREQAERLRRIARIRLDEVLSDELGEALSLADRQARELIRKRGTRLGNLNKKITSTGKQLATLEERRRDAREDCDSAAQALDRAEASSQQRLADNPAYQQQLTSTRRAELTAEHALEKTRRAKTRREQKGRRYESDPLFSYLWGRGYGTSSYSAGPLSRALDDWVAGLCGYRSARPDYSALLAIPDKLEEHTRRLRDAADEAFIELTKIEMEEAAVDGVPEFKEAARQCQARVDSLDQDIEEMEGQLAALEQQRGRFANGEDEGFREAVQTLSSAFERESLIDLYEYARATATPEDDVLVREFEDVGDQLEEARDTLADQTRVRERHADRLRELEQIRRKFKRKQFDSAHSQFRGNAALSMSLSQFLAGAVTARELWKTIERAQRYRKIQANPDFGSGDFLPRPGTWNRPFPRRRGGFGGGLGGGLGRIGRGRSRGGFKTGGGF